MLAINSHFVFPFPFTKSQIKAMEAEYEKKMQEMREQNQLELVDLQETFMRNQSELTGFVGEIEVILVANQKERKNTLGAF